MFERYVIKNGENLEIISSRFETNPNYLKDINNIAYEDLLRAGMEIIVPSSKKVDYYTTYMEVDGDTVYNIAKKYNINPELLACMNGFDLDDYIYKGQDILIPAPGYSYYVTKEGDTLNTVATTFNSKKEYLLQHNDTIYLLPGQLMVSRIVKK